MHMYSLHTVYLRSPYLISGRSRTQVPTKNMSLLITRVHHPSESEAMICQVLDSNLTSISALLIFHLNPHFSHLDHLTLWLLSYNFNLTWIWNELDWPWTLTRNSSKENLLSLTDKNFDFGWHQLPKIFFKSHTLSLQTFTNITKM